MRRQSARVTEETILDVVLEDEEDDVETPRRPATPRAGYASAPPWLESLREETKVKARRSVSSCIGCEDAVDADEFDELRDGDEFFDAVSWLLLGLIILLRWALHEKLLAFALAWWLLPAIVPVALLVPVRWDPRGDVSAAAYRAVLVTLQLWWVRPFALRLGVVLFATVLGHRLSVAVSRELAAVLLRDRRARRREEVPLKWHV